MTAKRVHFALVCLPPDEGGLIAIGGYNGKYIYEVESLDGRGATKWRQLAPLPLPLAPRGGVYFKQRILFVGGKITGGAKTSAMLAFTPPTAGGAGQWVTLKPKLPSPQYPMHITVCGNSLYLVSKLTFQHDAHYQELTPNWSCSFSFRWLWYSNCVQIQSDNSSLPRGKTGKRLKFKLSFLLWFFFYFCVVSFDLMIMCIYFPFKNGKDFGKWEWEEVEELFSVKTVQCGTSS